MKRETRTKIIAAGKLISAPAISFVISIFSMYMLNRYIRLFTTTWDPGAYLVLLLIWAVLSILGIAFFLCQVLPNGK
jgi:putative flippase GtrA